MSPGDTKNIGCAVRRIMHPSERPIVAHADAGINSDQGGLSNSIKTLVDSSYIVGASAVSINSSGTSIAPSVLNSAQYKIRNVSFSGRPDSKGV